ncbi:MAG: hypothetical protein GXP49_03120 [Deltaproteobacteria bacterium]|nr:hypothetical protein [Deltaproteobacteria bacterium]
MSLVLKESTLEGNLETSRFWAYAASFGALWGSLEITLGAFLHTLHVPFAGVILASAGAGLLVAQRQFFNRFGISLATGIVAASVKSISPGGIILGPMLGITCEALIVELILVIGPRSLPAAVLAGCTAGIWPLAQKLLYQVIMFSHNVIDLYLALLRKAGEWLGVTTSQGWSLLIMLIISCGIIGSLGGLTGWLLGRKAILTGKNVSQEKKEPVV